MLQPHQADLSGEEIKHTEPSREAGHLWNRQCTTTWRVSKNISRAFAEHQENVPAIKPKKAPYSTLPRALYQLSFFFCKLKTSQSKQGKALEQAGSKKALKTSLINASKQQKK